METDYIVVDLLPDLYGSRPVYRVQVYAFGHAFIIAVSTTIANCQKKIRDIRENYVAAWKKTHRGTRFTLRKKPKPCKN